MITAPIREFDEAKDALAAAFARVSGAAEAEQAIASVTQRFAPPNGPRREGALRAFNFAAATRASRFGVARDRVFAIIGANSPAPADDGPAAVSCILDPADPYPGAREFVERSYTKGHVRTLHAQGGAFFAYDGTHYPVVEEGRIRSELWAFSAEAMRPAKSGELVPFQPTITKINNLLDATRAVAHLDQSVQAPVFIDASGPNPRELIAMANGILHVPTRTLHGPTPRFFTHHALPFAYDPNVGEPVQFLAFLRSLWGDDVEAIATLQEMFAYFLLPDTSQQKALLIQGPKRSGKGTIARVLQSLLGERNVCSPTLAGLSSNFGAAPLIGKLLAIISDARLSGRADQAAIVEKLLAISGEDSVTIDRKHMSAWTGRLPTRFLILTNEVPRLADTSGALASRFVVLTLTKSFIGAEDVQLTDRLLTELPSILRWALDGWDRLHERGHFVQPASSIEAVRQLEDLGSPLAAFVRDRCTVEPGRRASGRALYDAWKAWCEDEGRDHPGTAQTFGRDLHAAVPGLRVTQPRVGVGGSQVRHYEGIGLEGVA